MRELRTARLVLEPLTRAHASEMFAVLSDPETFRFIDEQPPVSEEALAHRYARLESRLSSEGRERWLNWIAREASTSKAIGFVQATVREDGSALVAYVIAPAAQRQGYAREAAKAMIAELRSAYAAKRLRASVDPRNAASIALLVSLGFTNGGANPDGDAIFELPFPARELGSL